MLHNFEVTTDTIDDDLFFFECCFLLLTYIEASNKMTRTQSYNRRRYYLSDECQPSIDIRDQPARVVTTER
jgi:hypothetical protein